MNTLALLVPAVPMAAALLAALIAAPAIAAWLCIVASSAAFALACLLPWEQQQDSWLLVDPLAAHFAILTSFVGMTTAWYSRAYIAVEIAAGRLDSPRLRQYHALFLAFLACMLLAILANNIGVAWAAVEAATIAAVVVVGLPRTENAVEASWKFFLICGVGVALALFGTVLLYLAALPVAGASEMAMRWSTLAEVAPRCPAPVLNLAFVFLLIGYGTKAGLAPLHGWMPDAHAEGPTPVSAVLAGSIMNVALLLLLRLRQVLAGNSGALSPGPFIMALGLLSVLIAAFALWRRRDVKRFFAFSTIEQSGLAAFAFGLGGAGAMFAGLLHITLHTLAKAAVFQCVGRACQMKGGQDFTHLGGLFARHRALALTLAAAIVAVAALPPFGLFVSSFLIVSETARRSLWLAGPLVFGITLGAWGLMTRLVDLLFGPDTPDPGPVPGRGALVPAWLHLALVAGLGLAMPAPVVAWFTGMAAGLR